MSKLKLQFDNARKQLDQYMAHLDKWIMDNHPLLTSYMMGFRPSSILIGTVLLLSLVVIVTVALGLALILISQIVGMIVPSLYPAYRAYKELKEPILNMVKLIYWLKYFVIMKVWDLCDFIFIPLIGGWFYYSVKAVAAFLLYRENSTALNSLYHSLGDVLSKWESTIDSKLESISQIAAEDASSPASKAAAVLIEAEKAEKEKNNIIIIQGGAETEKKK